MGISYRPKIPGTADDGMRGPDGSWLSNFAGADNLFVIHWFAGARIAPGRRGAHEAPTRTEAALRAWWETNGPGRIPYRATKKQAEFDADKVEALAKDEAAVTRAFLHVGRSFDGSLATFREHVLDWVKFLRESGGYVAD